MQPSKLTIVLKFVKCGAVIWNSTGSYSHPHLHRRIGISPSFFFLSKIPLQNMQFF